MFPDQCAGLPYCIDTFWGLQRHGHLVEELHHNNSNSRAAWDVDRSGIFAWWWWYVWCVYVIHSTGKFWKLKFRAHIHITFHLDSPILECRSHVWRVTLNRVSYWVSWLVNEIRVEEGGRQAWHYLLHEPVLLQIHSWRNQDTKIWASYPTPSNLLWKVARPL